MCGIFGFITNQKLSYMQAKDNIGDFLKPAIITGSIRGMDSTGFFGVEHDDKVLAFKRAVDGSTFSSLPPVSRVLNNIEHFSSMVWHNRSATKGSVKDENAHPFNFDNITLVHNGTVTGYWPLITGDVPSVDSAAVAKALFQQEDPLKVLSSINGGYTLVWHDAHTGTINMAKNQDRPLAIAYHDKLDIMYFASEAGMLKWLLDRESIPHSQIWYPKEHVLFTWKLGTKNKELSVRSFKSIPYEPKKDLYSNSWDGYGNTRRQTVSNSSSNNTSSYTSHGYKCMRAGFDKYLRKLDLHLGEEVKFTITSKKKFQYSNDIEGADVNGEFGIKAFNVTTELDDKYIYKGFINGVSDSVVNDSWIDVVVHTVKKTDILVEDYFRNEPTKEENNIIPFEKAKEGSIGMIRGPKGVFITLDYFRELTEEGCVCCGTPLVDPKKINWNVFKDYPDKPVCDTCIGTWQIEVTKQALDDLRNEEIDNELKQAILEHQDKVH